MEKSLLMSRDVFSSFVFNKLDKMLQGTQKSIIVQFNVGSDNHSTLKKIHSQEERINLNISYSKIWSTRNNILTTLYNKGM